MIVIKAGGYGSVSAKRIRNVEQLTSEFDEPIKLIVSAPGKDSTHEDKVTDLAFNVHQLQHPNQKEIMPYKKIPGKKSDLMEKMLRPYFEVIDGLELGNGMRGIVESNFRRNLHKNVHQFVAQGDKSSAMLYAEFLGWDYVPAEKLICINNAGNPYNATTRKWVESLSKRNQVIEGFVGNRSRSRTNPDIELLGRNKSDYSQALVANGVRARLCINLNDVRGLYVVNPKTIPHVPISQIPMLSKMRYDLMRECSWQGDSAIHQDTLPPLVDRNIPIIIRSIDDLSHPGTLIGGDQDDDRLITAIGGTEQYVHIRVYQLYSDLQPGLVRKFSQEFSNRKINIKTDGASVDGLSCVVSKSDFVRNPDIVDSLTKVLPRFDITIEDMALISVVGRNIRSQPIVQYKIGKVLHETNSPKLFGSTGSSDNSEIIGVREVDYQKVVSALYKEFFVNYLVN